MKEYNMEKFFEELENAYDEDDVIYDKKIEDLYKKYKIVFEYRLGDAWGMPEYSIIIFDRDEDNVVSFKNGIENKTSLTKLELDEIKGSIKEKQILFNKELEVAFPPVLDGTSDNIVLSCEENFKAISCSNLWYWFEEDVMKSDKEQDEKNYTKAVIDLFTKIGEILNQHGIEINLYFDDEEEDE